LALPPLGVPRTTAAAPFQLFSARYARGMTMLDLLAAAVLIVIATQFAWSSLRAWRAKNRFMKWGGTSLAALLSVAAALSSGAVLVGLYELHARSAPVSDLKVAGTPEQIERGRRFPMASAAPAIQKPARSRAVSTSATIFQFLSERLFPPISLTLGNQVTGPMATFFGRFATASIGTGAGWSSCPTPMPGN
jgi:hypothetical protein